jgi:hypothetical protein
MMGLTNQQSTPFQIGEMTFHFLALKLDLLLIFRLVTKL